MQHRIVLILHWRKIQHSQFVEITWWHGCSKGDMRETLLWVTPWGKGGSRERSASWWWRLPGSPWAAAAGTVRLATREERHRMAEGSACYGMGYQQQRIRWPEMKAACCRSVSRLLWFREISRSTALWATPQQTPIPISPARCIRLLLFTDSWRMLPGGFIRSKWRRKGWALDWHTARDTISLPLPSASFYPCLKVSIHAIRSHLKQFSEHTISPISRTTDIQTFTHK